MAANSHRWRRVLAVGGFLTLLLGGLLGSAIPTRVVKASDLFSCWRSGYPGASWNSCDGPPPQELGGTWYWLRSPEQEKRVISSHFNRYCIRCHGVDGRGVWDIPDVPNFTNSVWQASRSDDQLARSILEGRGAVMPPFRGTLTLEEAFAMARYLRSFVPGTEASRPDSSAPAKTGSKSSTSLPGPKTLEESAKEPSVGAQAPESIDAP